MFRYIGTYNNSREITIIRHNSSGFDSYLVAQHFNLEIPPLISASKNHIINYFKPLYTCCFNEKMEKRIKCKRNQSHLSTIKI